MAGAGPAGIGQLMSSMNVPSMIWGTLAVMIGGFFLIGLCALVFFMWWRSRFPLKASYRNVYGDINGHITLGPRLKNRFGYNKNKTAMKAMNPWFNKKEFPPIPIESILGQNQVDAYRLPNGQYIASTHELLKEGNSVKGHMKPINPDSKKWAEIDLYQIAQDYDERDKNDLIRPYLLFGGVLLAGAVMFGLLLYGAYKGTTYIADKSLEIGQANNEICSNSVQMMAQTCQLVVNKGLNINEATVVVKPAPQ